MSYRYLRALALSVCWVTIAAGAALAEASAASAAPLSLEQAAQLAARDAPALTALRQRELAAKEEQARAGALPDPELVLGIDNLTATGNDAFAIGADPMTMRKIGLRQMLPAGAKRDAARTQARADTGMRAAELHAGALNVQRAAAAAWVMRWSAAQEDALLRTLLGDTRLALRAVAARVAAGGSASDDLNTRAMVLEIENRISANQARIAAAKAELARWLGDEAEREPAEPPDWFTAPLAEARALALLDRSADLLVFSAHEQQADAAVRAAKAERRPDFSVMAGYGQRAVGRDDMISLEFGIGLPLFTRNRQDRSVAARMAEHDALDAEHEDARRAAAAAVRSDYAQWAGLVEQVRRDQRERLPLLRDLSALALAGYRAGAPIDGWIDARRQEVEASIETSRRQQELGVAWANLAYRFAQESQP
ncbi:MAG: TolC family protein [Xanthomonadaceae bacterium]|nr:TolC family protein [Xanthomonadaceae bacterium]